MALYAAVTLAAVLAGYYGMRLFVGGAEPPPPAPKAEETSGAWYRQHEVPPGLITAPDHPLTHYEEPLPDEVFDAPVRIARRVVAPPPPTTTTTTEQAQGGLPDPAPPSPTVSVPMRAPGNGPVGRVVGRPQPEPVLAPEPEPEPESEELAALPPPSPPLPDAVEGDDVPAWLRHAVAVPHANGRPMIAVVIDDMGIDRGRSRRIMDLPGPLTLSFLPYMDDPIDQTTRARAVGHELMVHVSMEPSSQAVDPGPNVLLAGAERDEIVRRLDWALDRFEGYVGINNHMGSRFTADPAGMATVMEVLKSRELLFLDSRTTGATVGGAVARLIGVPFVERTVFLDNDNDAAKVERQLAELEAAARRNGYAVAIGHPREATIEALAAWLPTLKARGLALVPLSAVVRELEAKRALASANGPD